MKKGQTREDYCIQASHAKAHLKGHIHLSERPESGYAPATLTKSHPMMNIESSTSRSPMRHPHINPDDKPA